MAKKHSFHVNTGLRYEKAGVLFRIEVDLPEERADTQGATVRVWAENLVSGRRIPFTNAGSPAVADFMAGYPRWMVRVGVRATKGNDEVTGTVRADATVEDLVKAVSQMSDMIDQKFSLHRESVLA